MMQTKTIISTPSFSSTKQDHSMDSDHLILCKCTKPAVKRVSNKENKNKGREFFVCSNSGSLNCGYFLWGPFHRPSSNFFDSTSHFPSTTSTTTNSYSRFKSLSEKLSQKQSNPMKRAIKDDTDNSRIQSMLSHAAYVIYTDGSCKGNKNVEHSVHPAGWGVVILKPSSSTKELEIHAQLYGPVEVSRNGPDSMGAEVTSNNTAELCAIGEAMKWLLTTEESKASPVMIRYDSEYAAKSVMGQYNGEKNKKLIQTVRSLYHQALEQRRLPSSSMRSIEGIGGIEGMKQIINPIEFVHVKGHSHERWNDLADRLANLGATGARSCSTNHSTSIIHRKRIDDDDDDVDDDLLREKKRKKIIDLTQNDDSDDHHHHHSSSSSKDHASISITYDLIESEWKQVSK